MTRFGPAPAHSTAMSVPSFDLTLKTELFGDGSGETSVSAVAAAALQRNATAAIVNALASHCDRSYHFVIAVWRAKEAESGRVKYWEIIADNLSKAGWSWGCVSAMDSEGRTIWIADAHRDDGRRFIVRADEKLTPFLELELVTRR